jgi:hypothetical protein
MRRRFGGLALLSVLIVSGCTSVRPERVYVDVTRAVFSERAPELTIKPAPQPTQSAGAVTVRQPGMTATGTSDRTLERLQEAKRLIAENRGKSISALSSMLKRVYLARANDEIASKLQQDRPEYDTILAAALERLRQTFEAYGEERGPLLAKLSVLARNTELRDQAIPEGPDLIAKQRATEANKVRGEIRELDARYTREATVLLADAEKQIDAAIAAIEEQAKNIRARAEANAIAEAETTATKTQASLDVQVRQLVPEKLASVPARQVVVPGSAPLPPPPTDKTKPIFGSLEERRRLVDQEIDIWIKTTGRLRSTTTRGVRDATEEFLQWRRAHKVGP